LPCPCPLAVIPADAVECTCPVYDVKGKFTPREHHEIVIMAQQSGGRIISRAAGGGDLA